MKCKNCGSTDFVIVGNYYECTYCFHQIPIDNVEKQNIEQHNEKGKLMEILLTCLREPRFNETLAKEAALNLIKIDSNNVLAKLFVNYIDRNICPENYKDYIIGLKSVDFMNDQEDSIISFMINNSEYKFFSSIIDMLIGKNLYNKYSAMIYDAKKKIEEQEVNYSNVARDVFVCYSSNDLEIVKSIIEKIENDGNTCWYSERNMPKNSISQNNYKERIEEAIKSSKIFLVVMSENSMLSDDVKWELDIADKYHKDLRIEYRIQEVENTFKFKRFFDGIQWIDASDEPQEIILLGRIYDLLHQEEILSDDSLNALLGDKSKLCEDGESNLSEQANRSHHIPIKRSAISKTVLLSDDEGFDGIDHDGEIHNESLNEVVLDLFNDNRFDEAFKVLESYDELPFETENLVYYYIGYCFENGYGTETDDEKSRYYYNLAKTNGPKGSSVNLGLCFFLLGKREFMKEYNFHVKKKNVTVSDEDENDGYALLLKAADYGNAEAMTYLGLCCEYGLYVRKNEKDALDWFDKASENNDGLGTFHLGKCYEKGIGVTQDNGKAFNAYLKAATLGNDKGMVSVGVCCYYGIGTCQSYDNAVKYYTDAVDLGNVTAMYNLAQCYSKGHGVPLDERKGKELMQRAADMGFGPAKACTK